MDKNESAPAMYTFYQGERGLEIIESTNALELEPGNVVNVKCVEHEVREKNGRAERIVDGKKMPVNATVPTTYRGRVFQGEGR